MYTDNTDLLLSMFGTARVHVWWVCLAYALMGACEGAAPYRRLPGIQTEEWVNYYEQPLSLEFTQGLTGQGPAWLQQ